MCNNNWMLVHALIFLTQAYSIHRINWWLSHKRLAHDRCQLVKYFFFFEMQLSIINALYVRIICAIQKLWSQKKKHYREWFLTLILTLLEYKSKKICSFQLYHIVRNSIWLKKNRASDNVGKFHTYYLKCRVKVHLAHFLKIRLFLALFECSSTGNIWLLPVLKCLKRAKKSPIFQKKVPNVH